MAGDWIKLHRRALESFVNSDAGLMHLWINLLLRANWKPSWFLKQRIGIGQVAFSCGNLADQLKVSRRTLIRRLQELQDIGQIEVNSTNMFTVVSICKWRSYQDCCDTRDTTDVTSNAQQTPIKRPSAVTHPKKGRRVRKEEGKKGEGAPLELPPILNSPEFTSALESWQAYKGTAYKPRGLKAMLSQAAKRAEQFGVAAVIAAFEKAMANDWKGWDFESSFTPARGSPRTADDPRGNIALMNRLISELPK